jgi:parallel beta-helix repeat protein
MARALVVAVGGAIPVVREQLELRARELLGGRADEAPDLVSAVLADAGLVEVGDPVVTGGASTEPQDSARWQEAGRQAPIDLSVAPWGAEYSTISEALAEARPGDRILISPGTYDEAPTIDKAVHLIGEGDRSDVVLAPSGGAFLVIGATGATMEGLTIRTGIDVYSGQPSIIDCEITASPSHGIIIRDRAEPVIRGCAVHDNATSGLFIHSGARGELSESEIHGNGHHGIMVDGDAAPRVLQCQIHSNAHSGVYLSDRSAGVLTGNDIRNNGHCGVTAASHAATQLQGNEIHENAQSGIQLVHNSTAVMRGNDIHHNSLHGILRWASGVAAPPTVEGNEIHHNGQCGVEQSGYGSANYERNKVDSNGQDGFRVQEPASPVIVANQIASNAGSGVSVQGRSSAVVRGNRVHGNGRDGVSLEFKGISPTGERALAGSNKWAYLPVAVFDNEVTGNAGDGISARDAHGSICGNRITANTGAGVHLNGSLGLGYVQSNVIEGNGDSGVVCNVSGGSGPVVEWNLIRANSRSGIRTNGIVGGVFRDNKVDWNEQNGILVRRGGNRTVVVANTLKDNGGDGITIMDLGFATIRRNIVKGNAGHGLRVDSTSSPLLSDNEVSGNFETDIARSTRLRFVGRM